MLATSELQEMAATRAAVYRFFAGLFNEPIPTPGHDLAKALLSMDLRWDPEAEGEEIRKGLNRMEAFRERLAQADLEHEQYLLARERTRLVRGVKPGYGPRPPYEAVYGPHSSAQECFVSLLDVYHQNQVRMREESHERPDYLGTELDYLQCLATGEAGAWAEEDATRAVSGLAAAGRFLREHVLVWAPKYLDVMEQEASHPFFQAVALLLKGFLKEDQALVDQLLAQLTPASDGAVASDS